MHDEKKQHVVLVAGGTGLVGSELVRLLAQDETVSEVRVLTRRTLPAALRQQRITELIGDFEHLPKKLEWFHDVDIVFSALGTTIKKAGSQAAFRKVDFDYPLALAKAARAAHARHFLFVSALGANALSPFFYNRVKGELEEAILALGYPFVTIARPSLLLGKRQEHRFGEELAKKLSWLLPSPWAGVQAAQVAAALVRAGHENRPGVRVLSNREMRQENTDNSRAKAG